MLVGPGKRRTCLCRTTKSAVSVSGVIHIVVSWCYHRYRLQIMMYFVHCRRIRASLISTFRTRLEQKRKERCQGLLAIAKNLFIHLGK